MTNLEQLKAIYTALGGAASDVAGLTTNAEVLAQIAVQASVAISGACELPTVKAADNGDVLTVVSGKWAKAALPTELPAVTEANNGMVLTVVDGAWAAAALPD